MGIDLLDVAFRLEKRFGVRILREPFSKMVMRNDPPNITVGDLFDAVRAQAPQLGVFDLDLDADALSSMFQRKISDSLGVDIEEVTKDK